MNANSAAAKVLAASIEHSVQEAANALAARALILSSAVQQIGEEFVQRGIKVEPGALIGLAEACGNIALTEMRDTVESQFEEKVNVAEPMLWRILHETGYGANRIVAIARSEIEAGVAAKRRAKK